MSAPSKSSLQSLNAFLARIVVRLWPEETKQWGEALEAELSEITTPLASLHWVLGGVMLLTRERWKSFLRSFGRPVGVPAGSPLETYVENSRRVPRTPRIVTVLLFLASAAFLLNPDVRSCIRLSIRSIWTGHDDSNSMKWQPSRWGSVKRLHKEAETNRDPKLLALLSLLSAKPEERLELSDEAIRKDPSLTWLDFDQVRNEQHMLDRLPQGRMERLLMWDPDNAVLRELTARAAAHRSGTDWGSVSWPKRQLSGKGGLLHVEEGPDPDSHWLSTMNAVFLAPKYDTYWTQEFDLIREVTRKYGVEDPDISLYILAAHPIPNLMNLRSYNNWLVSQSEKKEKASDLAGALADARKALGFSQRMWLGQRSAIETLIADSLGLKACERLEALLQNPGQTGEASLVAFQKAEWNADIERSRFSRRMCDGGMQQAATWAGTTIFLATILILVASFICGVSVLMLWLKRTSADVRGRSLVSLSWALDAAPVVLLGACAVVYLSYQPFARAYHAYFTTQEPIRDFEGLFDAGMVTHVLQGPVTELITPVQFWTVVTVGLSLLATLLLFRMVARRLRPA